MNSWHIQLLKSWILYILTSSVHYFHNMQYQVISRHQTQKIGQNLTFDFLVDKWPSLGDLLRRKNRKSWKHVFYTNWTILSRKKIFFEKKFLNDPKSQKSPIYKIFWTALTNLLIFSGMIALDSAFQHIIPVCPGKIKKFYKKFKNCRKIHVSVIIEWSGFFPGNPALSLRPTHHPLSSCQKFWKSVSGKYHNFLWTTTDILTLWLHWSGEL